MTKKLFDFAKGKCAAESADNPMFQEVLLGGHLYLMVLKVGGSVNYVRYLVTNQYLRKYCWEDIFI